MQIALNQRKEDQSFESILMSGLPASSCLEHIGDLSQVNHEGALSQASRLVADQTSEDAICESNDCLTGWNIGSNMSQEDN